MGEVFHMSVPQEPTGYSKMGAEAQPGADEAARLAEAVAAYGQQPLPITEAADFGGPEYSPN